MNVVALVGNVASAPETKQTSGGRTVASFRLAVSRIGGEQADFFTVVTWERQAEICQEYLSVGRRVAIEGRLLHSQWKTEDKQPRSRVEVVAHRVELLGPRKRVQDEDVPQDSDSVDDTGSEPVAVDPFAPVGSSAADDPFGATKRESEEELLVV